MNTDFWLRWHEEKLGMKFPTVHDIRVSGNRKWLLYDSEEYKEHYLDGVTPNHRLVLPYELVIDVDSEDFAEEFRDYALRQIKAKSLTFSCWETGGKGFHFHLIFDALMELTEEDRKVMKNLLLDYIAEKQKNASWIDRQLCGRHMVRAEYGRHEKTGCYKYPLFWDRPTISNDIPIECIDLLKDYKTKQANWKPRRKINFIGIKDLPNCIKFLETDDFYGIGDGKKRALFILTSFFKYKLVDEDLYSKLKKWNEYNLNGSLKDIEIKSNIKSSNGSVSCRYRKEFLNSISKNEVCKGCIIENEKEVKDE